MPKVVAWFRRSAEQNLAGGQHKLGFQYANGRGVPQDYMQARMWFNLAAAACLPVSAMTTLY